ncbi:MAG: hypothetical protein N2C14_04305, partial [Planctomycetales bacterium]
EDDPQRIRGEASRRVSVVRKHAEGEHAEAAARLLQEIKAAHKTLTTPERKQQYDQQLQQTQSGGANSGGEAFDFGETDSVTSKYAAASSVPKNETAEERQEKVILQTVMIAAGAIGGLVILLILFSAGGGGDDGNREDDYYEPPTSYSSSSRPRRSTPRRSRPSRPRSPNDPPPGFGPRAPRLKTRSFFEDPSELPEWVPQGNPGSGGQQNVSDEALNRLRADLKNNMEQGRLADSRLEVPSPEILAEAKRRHQEKFAERLQQAQEPADKNRLAAEWVQEAQAAPPIQQYALLRESAELFADAGDAAQAWKTLDEVEKRFQVDALSDKEAALQKAAPAAKTRLEHKSISTMWVALLNVAIARDRFPDAARYAENAAVSGRSSQHELFMGRVTRGLAEVRQMLAAHELVKDAKQRHDSDPADAEAAAAWGRFTCLYKNQWASGLPLWSKGSDPEFGAIIQEDLGEPAGAAERLALADRWWAAAQQLQDSLPKKHLQGRAALWYAAALPQASPEDQQRVTALLTRFAQQHSPVPFNEWISLLGMVEPSQHGVRGEWSRDGLQMEIKVAEPQARFLAPLRLAAAYELQLQFKHSGGKRVAVILPIGSGHAVFLLDLGDNPDARLEMVNGQPHEFPAPPEGPDVPADSWNQLEIQV